MPETSERSCGWRHGKWLFAVDGVDVYADGRRSPSDGVGVGILNDRHPTARLRGRVPSRLWKATNLGMSAASAVTPRLGSRGTTSESTSRNQTGAMASPAWCRVLVHTRRVCAGCSSFRLRSDIPTIVDGARTSRSRRSCPLRSRQADARAE